MNIEERIRPNILNLKPYRSARHDFASGMLLDANENSYGSVIEFDEVPLHRYPDPFQTTLRSNIADLHGVKPENIFLGVGSDEVISLLITIFCEPRTDAVVITAPTYGMYRVAADIQGARPLTSLLTREFQLNTQQLLSITDTHTKLIFCCSPNNPTGNVLRRYDIIGLCAATRSVLVVDEAYANFSNVESLADQAACTPNLVVLRTLSKAWGLAGIRLGYAVAHPSVVNVLMKVKPPYNINAVTSRLALQALERKGEMQRFVDAIVTERTKLADTLRLLPIVERVFPSEANFLLARFKNASAVYHYLARRGIIVRDRSTEPLLENCLRITVGTPAENNALINALKEFVG